MKEVTCGSIIDSIKQEGFAIGFVEGRARGLAKTEVVGFQMGIFKGIAEGTLEILNILATDPDFDLPVDLLVKKFGYTREEILNGK